MIFAFYLTSTLATPALMDEIYHLRHKVFVEKLGWSALKRNDCRDQDQFDNDDALHVADIKNDRVMAYCRLLPTVRPHLLSHVYPDLLQGKTYHRAADIFEWTRLCARCEIGDGDEVAARRLLVAIPELCLRFGISSLIAQSHPAWVGRLTRLGWDARPLSAPVVYDGRRTQALEARVSERTVSTSRKRLKIDAEILDIQSIGSLAKNDKRLIE